jgi:hypothetical protein
MELLKKIFIIVAALALATLALRLMLWVLGTVISLGVALIGLGIVAAIAIPIYRYLDQKLLN